MKIKRNGKVVLSSIDHRVGNFVFTEFSDTVGMCDINLTVQVKVAKRTLVGQMLLLAMREKDDTFLHNYAGYLYYVAGIAPDDEFIRETISGAERCIKRHPQIYGDLDITDKEDAEVITEERELSEFESDLKKLAKADIKAPEEKDEH